MLVVLGQKGPVKNWIPVCRRKLKNVCESTKKHCWRNKTWWCNVAVDSAVKEKQRCWKTWTKRGSKEDYQKAKHLAKHAVYLAKSQANEEVLKDPSPSTTDFFRLSNQIRHENLDVQGEKPVLNDAGELCLDDRSKQAAWKTLWAPLQCWVRLGPWLPHRSLSRWSLPPPTHPPIPLEFVIKAISWWNVARLLVHPWLQLKWWNPLELKGPSRFIILSRISFILVKSLLNEMRVSSLPCTRSRASPLGKVIIGASYC